MSAPLTAPGRRARGRRWIVGVALFTALSAQVLWATAASAHTALLGSSPSTGEEFAYSPDEVTLSFAAPVRTSTMDVVLRRADGEQIRLEPLTTGERADVVAYAVPRLGHDIYSVAWESVGPDGHRVNGEIVFGVGTTPGSTVLGFGEAAALDRVVDGMAVLAQIVWYVGLSLLAGVVVLERGTGRLVAALASRRAAIALTTVGIGAALRGVHGVIAFAAAGGGLGDVLLTRSTLLWSTAALVAAMLRRRERTRPLVPSATLVQAPRSNRLVYAAVLLVVLGTIAGHAPTRPDPVMAVLFAVAHLGAAALWVGPLLVVALIWRGPAVRSLPVEERASELRRSVQTVAGVAGWAVAVAGASGGLLALRAWDGNTLTGSFLTALVLKSVVVAAVAIPLGVAHHRRRETWEGLPRSVRIELAALLGAMVLGGILVGLDPGWTGDSGGTDLALADVLDGSVGDPAACAALEVGRAACYRTTLEATLVADGPQPAIDVVTSLAQDDDYVIGNCHQVAHDLGNDAAERLPNLAVGLAVQDTSCWSGYTHGFIEAALARTETTDLAAELPSFCGAVAEPAYGFTHYNCVHGLGHGVMLTLDGDLFGALDLCDRAGEDWAVQSCASGVFMENVMAAQQGAVAEFDDTNLLYPCDRVDQSVANACFLMQTSHMLWRLDGDVAGAFAWCDTAAPAQQPSCYRSMGRDISANALLDGPETAANCGLGRTELEEWCINGAATNAVYDQSDAAAADPICAVARADLVTACRAGQDEAAAVLAAG